MSSGFLRTNRSIDNKTKYFVQVKYGEEAWDNVRRLANIDTPTFSIHHVRIKETVSENKLNTRSPQIRMLPIHLQL